MIINKNLQLNNSKTKTAMNAKLSILSFVFKRPYIYYIIGKTVTLSKINKKCQMCYNNFTLWKIETIVDVKHQKQPPRGVLKIFIEILGKLNGFL